MLWYLPIPAALYPHTITRPPPRSIAFSQVSPIHPHPLAHSTSQNAWQIEFAEPATWDMIKETLVKHEFPPEQEQTVG